MADFFGMRGTADWATDERPKSWRAGILRYLPVGRMPITAITNLMSSKKVNDPEFNWWVEDFPTRSITLTADTSVHDTAALNNAYASGGTVGTVLYVKTGTADNLSYFRVGQSVMFAHSTIGAMRCRGRVTARVENGTSSYIAVTLLEADTNGEDYDVAPGDNGTDAYISDCDRLMVIGNMNPEGGESPDGHVFNPAKRYNYTQIFRTTYELTRTAKATTLRTEDSMAKDRKAALLRHSLDMEEAFLYGVPYEGVGTNGKKERMTGGIEYAIRTWAPTDNVSDYVNDVDYPQGDWLDPLTDAYNGAEWLNDKLQAIFQYGTSDTRLAICGAAALRALETLALRHSTFNIDSGTKEFGIDLRTWQTSFGTIKLMTHPLMSTSVVYSRSAFILEPSEMDYRFITDTKNDKDTQDAGIDGTREEFLTECGLEFGVLKGWGLLQGLGSDNTVSL